MSPLKISLIFSVVCVLKLTLEKDRDALLDKYEGNVGETKTHFRITVYGSLEVLVPESDVPKLLGVQHLLNLLGPFLK